MVDSGLGGASGSETGAAESPNSSTTPSTTIIMKRPFAHPPMKKFFIEEEQHCIEQLRQKFHRQGARLHQQKSVNLLDVFRTPVATECPEEILRFSNENLLTFPSLLVCPLPVRTDYEQACMEEPQQVRKRLFLL